MDDWEDVAAFTRALPGVEMASYYGHSVPKLNGKPLVSPSRAEGSFTLYVSKAEKELLFETDSETFWQTAHFAHYPALLVRYGTDARERIELYIRRAWWDRAKKAQRIAAGMEDRP